MKKRNRIISLMLCGVLILSLVPQTVFGAEVTGAGSSEDSGQNLVLQSEEECICETLCTEDSINAACPVCNVEGADFSKCQGAADQTEDVPDPAVTAVQEQLDALPTVEEVAGMDQEQQLMVKEQVQTVQEAYNALTQEQQAEVVGVEIIDALLAVLANGEESTEIIASGTSVDGNFSWSLDNQGLLTITGSGEHVGSPWRNYEDSIKEVKINEGLTSITNTFSNCKKLVSVELPDSLKTIGPRTFQGCSSLVSIKWPDGLTSIGEEAFNNCSSLILQKLPDGIVSIGDYAFCGCSSISLADLPDEIISVGDYAFMDCDSIVSIKWPDEITSIGVRTFSGCGKLAQVELPNGLKEIGEGVFGGCKNLKSISLPDTLQTIGASAFQETGLVTLTIPEEVTFINVDAFFFCENLHEVTFEGEVAPEIRRSIFDWDLTIYVPAGAVGYTEENHWPMRQIAHPIILQEEGNGTVSASETAAKPGAWITLTTKADKGYRFKKWEVLSGDITITDNEFLMPSEDVVVKAIFEKSPVPGEIAYGTFGEDDCLSWSLDENGVLTVTGVENMPYCEWNCEHQEESMDQIPWEYYKNQITKIIIEGGITTIPLAAFKNYTSLKTVNLSDKIIDISSNAFSGCTNLETINLPDSLIFIGDSTFANCSNLILTELPKNLQYIGSAGGHTFENCTKLSLTSLPDTIDGILDYTFSGCINLSLTELPSSVSWIGNGAFKGCANLKLTRIPSRIYDLGKYAFQDCTNLTMMKLPGNFERIDEGTFAGCSNLSFVELPDGLRYIEESAFEDCSKLSTLEVPDSLLLIGQNAFRGCSGLTSLELPKNLDSIESGACDGCTNLEELTFDGKVAPLLDANMFDDCENLTIYIPSGAVGYTEENNWPEELIAHPITVQNDGNGTASASRTAAKAGTEIILIAKPDDGYQFAQWEVVSGGVTIEDDTFTMPMGDVTVKARFEKTPDQGQEPEKDRYYTLHFDTNGGSSLGFVYEKEDTAVSLLHYIPVRAGYQFTGWYEDMELTKKITSVRLDENMIVYAGWEKIETDTREEQKISMMNALQVRDLKNGSRTTSSKVCTLKLGFAADDPDLELTYTTSDPSVATVKDGKITYQGVGECTITVTAEETETCKAASLSITVKVGALGTPTFTPSVTAKTAKKAFTVTSSTVRGVDGWEVQYSIRKDFWKPVTKDFSDTGEKLYRKTCPTMQSNRTYYIHVRGYQGIDGEKVYSDWSPVKTIKTK